MSINYHKTQKLLEIYLKTQNYISTIKDPFTSGKFLLIESMLTLRHIINKLLVELKYDSNITQINKELLDIHAEVYHLDNNES